MGMREKLIEFVHDARMNAHWHGAKDPIKYMVDMLIANGVTIPVLCGECRHFHHDDDRLAQHCRIFGAMTEEDDFCSYGERRTDV